MKKNILSIFMGLILLGSVVIVGCTGVDGSSPTSTIPESGMEGELSQEEIVGIVKADLSERKGIDSDEIAVPNLEEKTWDDASLGCPQEGEMYAQVQTSGYQITLAIGDAASIEQFDYRTDTRGNYLLCE
jgi:hypothetical protein